MTRRSPGWPLAVALLLSTTSVTMAQAPMVPDTPPPPPVAPTPPTIAKPKAAAPPGVAAIVNGKKIFRYQVANEALKQFGPQLVTQMIIIELINQEAAKQNVIVAQAQVDARLADIQKQYAAHGIPGGLDAMLAQRHLTRATYIDQLKTELKVEALVAKNLPPPIEFHARHLLILTVALPNSQAGPGAKPLHTDVEALALIAKAQADLKAGKSFADVANQYTEDPSGKRNGGDLGIIGANGLLNPPQSLDPAFLHAALALKPGEVSATPVKSSYGYHLIKLDSSSAAPLPTDKQLYDAATPIDRQQQLQQAIPGYVQKLRSSAEVTDYLTSP